MTNKQVLDVEITMDFYAESGFDTSEHGVEFNALAYTYFKRQADVAIEEMATYFTDREYYTVKTLADSVAYYTEIMQEIEYEIETSHGTEKHRFHELAQAIDFEYCSTMLSESTEYDLFHDENLEEYLTVPTHTVYEIFDCHYLKKADAEYVDTKNGQFGYEINEVELTKNELANTPLYVLVGDMQIQVDVSTAVHFITGVEMF